MLICKTCGCRFDELSFRREIDGTDENGDLVVTLVEYCPECGSEEIDAEPEDEEDFYDDAGDREQYEEYEARYGRMDDEGRWGYEFDD